MFGPNISSHLNFQSIYDLQVIVSANKECTIKIAMHTVVLVLRYGGEEFRRRGDILLKTKQLSFLFPPCVYDFISTHSHPNY